MIVITSGRKRAKYIVDFRHDTDRRTGYSECKLYSYGAHELLGTGVSMLGDGDNFNRARGRKISLARALKQAVIPRPERKKLWADFFTKVSME